MAHRNSTTLTPAAGQHPWLTWHSLSDQASIFSMPTITDYNSRGAPLIPAQDPTKDDIYTFVLRVIFFITCISGNSTTLVILHSNVNEGRATFAQFMLINIASVDILTCLAYYPAIFVKFTHGRFVWLAQGLAGDLLCKLYNFLLYIPEKVLIFSLVSLACDAARNSSLKGRREHGKKFNLIVTVLFWMTGACFSAIYLSISKARLNMDYQSFECSIEEDRRTTVIVLNLIHSFVFVVTADVILTIVSFVVFIRIRRQRKEIKKHRRENNKAKSHAKMGRQRGIGFKKDTKVHDTVALDQEMQPIASGENTAEVEAINQSHTSSVIPVELKENKNTLENHDQRINKNQLAIRKSRKSVNKQKRGRKQQSAHNGRGTETQDARQAAQRRFNATQTEAKIMGAISSLFVIISLTQLVLSFACPSCSVNLFVQIAAELYAVVKPGIYYTIDPEFRKKYKQPFSLPAWCRFRRKRCRVERN